MISVFGVCPVIFAKVDLELVKSLEPSELICSIHHFYIEKSKFHLVELPE